MHLDIFQSVVNLYIWLMIMTIIYINLLAFFYDRQKWLATHWQTISNKLMRSVVRRLGVGYSFTLASYIYWIYHKYKDIGFRRAVLLNQISAQNYQLLMNEPPAKSNIYSRVWRTKNMLEKYIYYENPLIIEQIRNIASQLDKEVASVESRAKTPILSPLHMCSDMLAAIACSMVQPYSTSVISIYNEDYFGLNENNFFKKNKNTSLQQVNPEKASTKLARTLKKTQKRQENIVIFADALPQITESIVGYSMPTKLVKLFGREGRLYSGIDRLTTMVDAEVIFFYLYWENNTVKLRTFPAVSKQELTTKTSEYIETALKERPTDWFMWHATNLFYLNTEK